MFYCDLHPKRHILKGKGMKNNSGLSEMYKLYTHTLTTIPSS